MAEDISDVEETESLRTSLLSVLIMTTVFSELSLDSLTEDWVTDTVVDSVDVTWLELMVDDSSFFWMTVTSSWFSFPPSSVLEI